MKKTRVRLSREERLDLFYEQGFELIASQGFVKLSLRQLCAHMGVTTGSFFHYFADKNAYLAFLLDRLISPDIDSLTQNLAEVATYHELVDTLIAHFEGHLNEYLPAVRLFLDIIAHDKALVEQLMAQMAGHQEQFVSAMTVSLENLKKLNQVEPSVNSPLLAMTMFSLLDNLLLQLAVMPPHFDGDQAALLSFTSVRQSFQFIYDGVRPIAAHT